jgi:3-oxoacyl-(acyl-carrier-protein) synthase
LDDRFQSINPFIHQSIFPLLLHMNHSLSIAAANVVTEADLPSARLGQRFGRLDLQSRLALLAVASLQINFGELPRDRIGIVLGTSAGSLTTDVNFWNGRNDAGGPSPTLFAYTLPSAAAGEIAIHFGLTGPDLCFVGDHKLLLPEAAGLIHSGKVGGCVCVFCEVVSPELAKIIAVPAAASAWALFLRSSEGTRNLREWREFDRDMKSLCALPCRSKSVS